MRGAIDRRMACSINNTLREIGEPWKRHWSVLLGFSVAQLQAHLEAQFTEGMTWDRFMAGEIQIDHTIPQSWFPYRTTTDLAFRDCWSLGNLQPLWAFNNKSKGARYAGGEQELLDPKASVVNGS